MRLNAYLARAGVASRRRADELIRAGRVTVNGRPVELGTAVHEGDRVQVDGRDVAPHPPAYVLLHKPAGAVTTARDTHARMTVVELVQHPARLVPVGRLDADTTGALLLTNDGELAHRLAHPRYGVEREYVAEVAGVPGDAALRRLAEGVELEDGRTAPARVRLLRRDGAGAVLSLVLREGRKREVKRMCRAVGHPVVRLHRRRFAGLSADDLPPGGWRELGADEVRALRRLVGLRPP